MSILGRMVFALERRGMIFTESLSSLASLRLRGLEIASSFDQTSLEFQPLHNDAKLVKRQEPFNC